MEGLQQAVVLLGIRMPHVFVSADGIFKSVLACNNIVDGIQQCYMSPVSNFYTKHVSVDTARCIDIFNATLAQDNDEWLHERRYRITSSKNRSVTTSYIDLQIHLL